MVRVKRTNPSPLSEESFIVNLKTIIAKKLIGIKINAALFSF